MLLKILFVVLLVALVDRAKSLKCYSCNDDRDYGNCEGIGWGVIKDCHYGCVTYQAKIQTKSYHAVDFFARYRRGCAGKGGCDAIKKDLLDVWNRKVPEFDCKECKVDYCNNRANHPGYKFASV